ncbi:MAG: hypothetical protein EBS21_12195 [Sphingomonadaceae bacterium]|nr:hypothetical protein [Sphingomonadaceae bacterium]
MAYWAHLNKFFIGDVLPKNKPKTFTEALEILTKLGVMRERINWQAISDCFAAGRAAFADRGTVPLGFCGDKNSQFLKRPNAIGLDLPKPYGSRRPMCYTCIGDCDELKSFNIVLCYLAGTPAGEGSADHHMVDVKQRAALALLNLALMAEEYPYPSEIVARWLLIAIVSCGTGATGVESVSIAVDGCPKLEEQLQLLPAYKAFTVAKLVQQQAEALEADAKLVQQQAEALKAETERIQQQAEALKAETEHLKVTLGDQISMAANAEAAAFFHMERAEDLARQMQAQLAFTASGCAQPYTGPIVTCPCGSWKPLQYTCPQCGGF